MLPGPDIQIAVTEYLVESKAIEGLDELAVGHRQGRYVAGKKLIVVLARLMIVYSAKCLRTLEKLKGAANDGSY